MLTMPGRWPLHAEFRGKPKPNDAHDAPRIAAARSVPRQAKAK